MGFVGSLQDLSLDNILQVVSLSSQTGLLNLRDGDAGGEIAFRQGEVVGAWVELPGENVFNWLVRRGVIDQERLEKALELLPAEKPPRAVVDILQKHFGIDPAAISQAGRKEVEKVLTDLLCWEKGTFSFETCKQEELADHLRSASSILLDEGIRPFFSLNPGESPAAPIQGGGAAPFENGPIPEPLIESEASPEASSLSLSSETVLESTGEVFLVDDDSMIREKLVRDLSGRGWVVSSFSRSGELLAELDKSVDQGCRPTLLIDLVMPRFNGEGILGGLELLELVRSRYPVLPILMYSDYFCSETEKRIQELGVAQLIVKPHRRSLANEGSGPLDGFVERVARVLPIAEPKKTAEEAAAVNTVMSAKEIRDPEPSLPDMEVEADTDTDPIHRQLSLLRTLSTELCAHDLEEQSRLLVLRFAAELFDRAVIFSICGDRMKGAGQFGFENFSGVQGNRLGELVISLKEPSIFTSVLDNRAPVKRHLGSGDWERCFAKSLDGPPAAEIFLGPVLCRGKVVSILYGDTLPGGQPFGETAGLEVFLNQVGLLKERVMLQAALGRTVR
jgi:CheY-like chemotaxis protein